MSLRDSRESETHRLKIQYMRYLSARLKLKDLFLDLNNRSV